MPEFIALFDFERRNSEQYPDDEKGGKGSIKIWAEREPATQEEFDEVTKTIFKQGEYTQVALTHLLYDDNNLFANLAAPTEPGEEYVINASHDGGIADDVIQGEIVAE